MNSLKRIMVGLDLSEMDETLIRYTAFLCSISEIERVYFIHAEKSLDIPDEVYDSMPNGMPADEKLRTSLIERVDRYFGPDSRVQVEVQVVEGSPLKELLHWSKVKQIDLVVVGRKFHMRGSGVLAQKILRTGRVSVLFVPENEDSVLSHIMVSVDFSEYSLMALERMLSSALPRPEVRITCLHVYQVPSGYITLGMSYEDFDERMKGFARNKFEQVLDRFPELRDRATLRLVKQENEDDVGELIMVEAKRAKADMLVIGAKGKSAAALFVLGSVTEKILRYNDDIPMIVYKKEKEEIGFLDALLSND
ncbi:universal stress protein [Pontibacter ramchanderi]|uniref:Nucleotide-binding universal stress UspA family protein n=1 Tax=Pontibacter ramchanderi TaxID=1179743 RepID=A0A2N3V1V5_9BACT|nr:universal stress protein [Pontibacter ramchanderi]PKV75605.1 nucleotide-binding universal stress UspA family protein [Pontibacter ramchanderi]